MIEKITTRALPEKVWEAWEKAQKSHGGKAIEEGVEGRTGSGKGFRFRIFDVVPGERFSVVWKTLFVHLVFTHSVVKLQRGSEISYSFQFKGLFAIPMRWLLGNKIRRNLSYALRTLARQLEQ